MNIEFKWVWDANSLGCIPNIDGKKDYVVEVHWRYRGVVSNDDPNKDIMVDNYGVQNFNVEDADPNYIPFEDLTEDIIVGWLTPILDIDAMQLAITNQIDSIINPSIIYPPLPF